ncbi:MAG: hypothetical protein K2W85_05635 [Phycisphaerales bacterium]|nr:hypothetical protein [Phycisphaerales bacterium]
MDAFGPNPLALRSAFSPSQIGSVLRTQDVKPEALADGLQDVRRGFASVLGRAQGAGSSDADESPEQAARRSAESLVAMTFIQPLLKQLRDTTTAAPPFAPTQGEKQFQGLMDAELALRLVRKGDFPIVERIADKLLRKSDQTTASENKP